MTLSTKHTVLEVAKADDDYCHVVQRPSKQRVFENVFYSHAAHFVDVLYLILDRWMILVIVNSFPNAVDCFVVFHFVKDAVAAEDDVIVFSLNFE